MFKFGQGKAQQITRERILVFQTESQVEMGPYVEGNRKLHAEHSIFCTIPLRGLCLPSGKKNQWMEALRRHTVTCSYGVLGLQPSKYFLFLFFFIVKKQKHLPPGCGCYRAVVIE